MIFIPSPRLVDLKSFQCFQHFSREERAAGPLLGVRGFGWDQLDAVGLS